MQIVLVSLPFFDIAYPHAGLGALHAYLLQQEPTWKVHVELAHIEVASWDPALYKAIADSSFEAERIYATTLYPQYRDALVRHWKRLLPAEAGLGAYVATLPAQHRTVRQVVEQLSQRLEAHLDELVASRDWNGVVVGLTTTSQLFANLALARRIKNVAPSAVILLGGPSVSPTRIADSIMQTFPWVDFIIRGEGEMPLVALVRKIERGEDGALPTGVVSREVSAADGGLWQVPDLDSLPIPIHDNYFRMLSFLTDGENFVAVEGSRGCWWDRTLRDPKSTCRFCNLNIQWDGYRQKSAERVGSELAFLATRYRQTKIAFVDNIVRTRGFNELMDNLAGLGIDLEIFHEARANLRPDDILRFHDAGLRMVQFGLEGLSNSFLRRINKGTSVIMNLEVMKTCAELKIASYSNLILGFPGSTVEEVQETIETIDEYAFAYEAANLATYELGIDSVVSKFPEDFGVRNVRNHDRYAEVLPPDVFGKLVTFQFSYDDDRTADWAPVAARVYKWRDELASGEVQLTYQEGGTFCRVRRFRTGHPPQVFVLRDLEAEVYSFCHRIRRTHEVLAALGGSSERDRAIENVLARLRDQRILYSDRDRNLSLAMSPDPARAAHRIRRQAASLDAEPVPVPAPRARLPLLRG